MTRRRRTLLVVLALLLLAGGFAWYWQATAVDRKVDALLDEVRSCKPGPVEQWLIKLGLTKDPATGLSPYEVADDLAKLGPSAVPELVRALRDGDLLVRLTVVDALGKLGDARAVEPLIAALKHEDRSLRSGAALALADLGDVRAAEPLEELLSNEDSGVRHAARMALRQLRRQSEGKP